MRERKLQEPIFHKDSIGLRCTELFAGTNATWREDSVAWADDGREHARYVTWARYPYRYWLGEKAIHRNTPFMKRSYLEHQLFEVAMMSALNLTTERHLFRRWYIVQRPHWQTEGILYLEHHVQSPEKERQTGGYADAMNFLLENNLTAPNSLDMRELDMALTLAEMDGVNPLAY